MKKIRSKEYMEGEKSAKKGLVPTNNPYTKGSKKYNDWLDGLIDKSL